MTFNNGDSFSGLEPNMRPSWTSGLEKGIDGSRLRSIVNAASMKAGLEGTYRRLSDQVKAVTTMDL